MDKSIQTRDKLLEVAAPLFAKKGFAGTSIREIAQAAELNSSLISYYFGGKHGLYAAMIDDQFARVKKLLETIQSADLDPVNFLRQYAVGLGRLHRERPFLIRLVQGELTNPTECFEAILQKNIAIVAGILSRQISTGIERGYFKPDVNPLFAALTLAGMINFYFIVSPIVGTFVAGGDEQTDMYVNQAIEIYLEGLIARTGQDNNI